MLRVPLARCRPACSVYGAWRAVPARPATVRRRSAHAHSVVDVLAVDRTSGHDSSRVQADLAAHPFSRSSPPRPPATADEHALGRILDHSGSNVRRHAPRGDRVTDSLLWIGGGIASSTITSSSRGEAEGDRLFERLWSRDASRSGRSGLGAVHREGLDSGHGKES